MKSSVTHFPVSPLEFVRNQHIEINADKVNGGVQDIKDINEKHKDLTVSTDTTKGRLVALRGKFT